jgi:transcriptional regulator with XRE-family HTH domain
MKLTLIDELLAAAQHRRLLPEPAVRRLLRERAGITQEEVAQVLGVDRASVSRYEAGIRDPRGDARKTYIELLDRLAVEMAHGEPRKEVAELAAAQ